MSEIAITYNIILGVLGALIVLLGYTTWNLLKKNERAEDILVSYRDYFVKFQDQINRTDKRLQEIDQKGMFSSDDEIGWFFKEINKLQDQIRNFKIDA
jgi:hypothetical protein